jgi:hypothetical protein
MVPSGAASASVGLAGPGWRRAAHVQDDRRCFADGAETALEHVGDVAEHAEVAEHVVEAHETRRAAGRVLDDVLNGVDATLNLVHTVCNALNLNGEIKQRTTN